MARLDDTTSIDSAHAYRLQRVARLLRLDFQRLAAELGLEVSIEQWFLLWRVYERGPCAQRELADPAIDDRANITRLIERLEAAGWLERDADIEDARRKLVQLTPAGRARFERLFPGIIAERVRLFGGLDPRDLEAFERVLDHLEAAVGG